MELSIQNGDFERFKTGMDTAEKYGNTDLFSKIGMQSESEMLVKYSLNTGDLSPDEVKALRAYEVFESRGTDLSELHSFGLLEDEQLIVKYDLKEVDTDTLNKNRSFEFLTHNDIDESVIKRTGVLRDQDIISKYSFLDNGTDKSVLNFYRKAEYYTSKGDNIANIKVGDWIKETDIQLSLEERIIVREAQDLSVADFLEFSGKEKGIHSSPEVGKAVQKAQTKIKVMKGLRKFETYSNVAMTAIFVVQTACFIVDLVDDYKKGDVTSREAAKKVTEYVGGLVGGITNIALMEVKKGIGKEH